MNDLEKNRLTRRRLQAELERARRALEGTQRQQFANPAQWKATLRARERQVQRLEEQLAKLGAKESSQGGSGGPDERPDSAPSP